MIKIEVDAILDMGELRLIVKLAKAHLKKKFSPIRDKFNCKKLIKYLEKKVIETRGVRWRK